MGDSEILIEEPRHSINMISKPLSHKGWGGERPRGCKRTVRNRSKDILPLKNNFAAYKAYSLSLSSLMPPRQSCGDCGDAHKSVSCSKRRGTVEGPTANKWQLKQVSHGSCQGQASSMDHYSQRTPRIFPRDAHASLYEKVGGGGGVMSLFWPIPTRVVLSRLHSMRSKEKKATSSYFYLNKDARARHNLKRFTYIKSFLLLQQVYEVGTINAPIVLFSKQQG